MYYTFYMFLVCLILLILFNPFNFLFLIIFIVNWVTLAKHFGRTPAVFKCAIWINMTRQDLRPNAAGDSRHGDILHRPQQRKCNIAFIHQFYYQRTEFEDTTLYFDFDYSIPCSKKIVRSVQHQTLPSNAYCHSAAKLSQRGCLYTVV